MSNPVSGTRPARTPDLESLDLPTPERPTAGGARLDSLLDMMLPVTIEFGRTTLSMQEVLDLGPGSVIQLDRLVGEPVDIFVSDRRMAEGEVVVIGERFGIRITRVLPRQHESGAGRGDR
ncbi:MAG: flagellar motor switch protein FliN [Gemmatimonadales bacterium]|nr:flagellar motor switch protein FliN [Gemmatimonadales bacterium]